MVKNFFNISDLSKEQIFTILNNVNKTKDLQDRSIGLLFEKYSTRTRLSFAVGISSLGGNFIEIKFD